MPKSTQKNQGFTLIELLIVVAIIGILSSIAVPFYKLVQAKSRRAELYLALSGVYTTEIAYFASNNSWKGPECVDNTFCYCSTAGAIPNWDHNFATGGFNLSSPAVVYGFCINFVGGGFEVHGGGNIDKDLTLDHGFVTSGNRVPTFTCDDVVNVGVGC